MTAKVMAWALSSLAQGQRVALASVVETAGSVPGKVGARLAMAADGQWFGTVGGAGLEMKVLQRCREHLIHHHQAFGEVLRAREFWWFGKTGSGVVLMRHRGSFLRAVLA